MPSLRLREIYDEGQKCYFFRLIIGNKFSIKKGKVKEISSHIYFAIYWIEEFFWLTTSPYQMVLYLKLRSILTLWLMVKKLLFCFINQR